MRKSIEFSHAPLREGVTVSELTTAILRFEEAYLAKRPAFLFHALVTNMEGRYGHFVVASDSSAFEQAMKDIPNVPEFGALMAALDAEQIKMWHHTPLHDVELPTHFGGFEQGMFRPNPSVDFTEALLLKRAKAVREAYLQGHPEYLQQVISSSKDGQYGELVFTRSWGHAQQTCQGYLKSEVCGKMLELCDPESTDLSFWVPLVQRSFTQ